MIGEFIVLFLNSSFVSACNHVSGSVKGLGVVYCCFLMDNYGFAGKLFFEQ